MSKKHFEVAIIGAGIAGISLTYHLLQSPKPPNSILLIDQKDPLNQTDRFLSFWHDSMLAFSPIIQHQWDRLDFYTDSWSQEAVITPYNLNFTTLKNFSNYFFPSIMSDQRVMFIHSKAKISKDSSIVTNQGDFSADWIFDGSYPAGLPRNTVYMHSASLEIQAQNTLFHPQAATFFDFRRSLNSSVFHYVLPFTPKHGIVQSVFLTTLANNQDRTCFKAIKAYMPEKSFKVISKQSGAIPLLPRRPRLVGNNIIRIGLNGGLVNAATGYGLISIWRDSQNIARSLEKHNHPLALSRSSRLSTLCEQSLLYAIRNKPDVLTDVYKNLFQRNNPCQTLEFLDGTISATGRLLTMAKITPWPFLRAGISSLIKS